MRPPCGLKGHAPHYLYRSLPPKYLWQNMSQELPFVICHPFLLVSACGWSHLEDVPTEFWLTAWNPRCGELGDN